MSKHTVQSAVRKGLVAAVLLGAAASSVQAELPKGKPFQELATQIQENQIILQKQIDTMLGQLEALSSASEQHTGQISLLNGKIELAEQQLALLDAALAGKQAKITSSCSEGSAIRAVHDDGTVECEKDSGGGFKYVSSETVVILPVESPTVTCPDGYKVVGGGYIGSTTLLSVVGNGPSEDGRSWTLDVINLVSPIPSILKVTAMCALQ
jgi:hypothetical protein